MRISRLTLVVGFVASGVLTLPALAAEPPDKSGYHLFNPTPRELMRDLSADRPDLTESPITVDAGHFQLEMSFVDYSRDKERGQRTEAWTIADTNLKLGLTHNMDLQFVFAAYSEETLRRPGPDRTRHGFSDLTLRWKINLWGNDGGATAFGVMPFITIPTGTELSTDRVEGGLIVPFGWDVTESITVGLMAEIDAVYDDEDRGYDAEFVHTATCGFDIAGPLGGFVEYAGILSSDPDTSYQALFVTGLTYAVSGDLVLDTGVRIGLNDAAEDLGVFAGMTLRY
jgi:hypothetical protein